MIIYFFVLPFLLPILIFIFYFRDLLFRTASKPRIIPHKHPNREILNDLLSFYSPQDKDNSILKYLNDILSYFDNLLYKEKVVIVFGEGSPGVYDESFLKIAELIKKETGTKIEMLGGPVFLKENDNYILEAAKKNIINLYIPSKRIDIHFRVNLYTGNVSYENPHEPDEMKRETLYLDQNYFEAKSYIKKFWKLRQRAKEFNSCNVGEDYMVYTHEELSYIKNCLKEKDIRTFNDYTTKEIMGFCPL